MGEGRQAIALQSFLFFPLFPNMSKNSDRPRRPAGTSSGG